MQQVKFGSAAVEGEVAVLQRQGGGRGRRGGEARWFSLTLQQDGVLQLVEARHRAALALPRI